MYMGTPCRVTRAIQVPMHCYCSRHVLMVRILPTNAFIASLVASMLSHMVLDIQANTLVPIFKVSSIAFQLTAINFLDFKSAVNREIYFVATASVAEGNGRSSNLEMKVLYYSLRFLKYSGPFWCLSAVYDDIDGCVAKGSFSCGASAIAEGNSLDDIGRRTDGKQVKTKTTLRQI